MQAVPATRWLRFTIGLVALMTCGPTLMQNMVTPFVQGLVYGLTREV